MRTLPHVLLACLLLTTCGLARAEPPPFDRAGHLIMRGRSAAAAGDTLSALSYYRDAVSAAPRRVDGYVALGELYLQLGEPARALEAFQAGARWSTRGEALFLGLAAAHGALGDESRALDALRELRHREPESLRGLSALADAAEARGSFVEALAVRRSLLSLLASAPGQEEAARAQQLRVRALEVLLGNADIVRARATCSTSSSEIARALARCPR